MPLKIEGFDNEKARWAIQFHKDFPKGSKDAKAKYEALDEEHRRLLDITDYGVDMSEFARKEAEEERKNPLKSTEKLKRYSRFQHKFEEEIKCRRRPSYEEAKCFAAINYAEQLSRSCEHIMRQHFCDEKYFLETLFNYHSIPTRRFHHRTAWEVVSVEGYPDDYKGVFEFDSLIGWSVKVVDFDGYRYQCRLIPPVGESKRDKKEKRAHDNGKYSLLSRIRSLFRSEPPAEEQTSSADEWKRMMLEYSKASEKQYAFKIFNILGLPVNDFELIISTVEGYPEKYTGLFELDSIIGWTIKLVDFSGDEDELSNYGEYYGHLSQPESGEKEEPTGVESASYLPELGSLKNKILHKIGSLFVPALAKKRSAK